MRRYSYTERFCTDKLLHADAFTHRGSQRFYAKIFFTQKFLHTYALHKDAFARINKGTQALLHTEPLAQRNNCTEQFLHKETFTQENFDTEKFVHTDCTNKFFTHRNFYTQKLYPEQLFTQKLFRTEAFTHRSLYAQQFLHRRFYTQMPLLRKLLHTSLCTHHAFTHSQLLDGEALLPLLDHLPFVFPSQVALLILHFLQSLPSAVQISPPALCLHMKLKTIWRNRSFTWVFVSHKVDR